jgi:general secretion pathway protein M
MAMSLLPEKGKGQVMALGLLAVAIALFYYVCIHWFVAGHLEVSKQIAELKESERRFREEISKQPAIQKRTTEVDEYNATNVHFLADENFDKGAATLTTKIKEAVQAHGNSDRCGQPTVMPQQLGLKEPYQRVSTQVQLRCDLDDTIKILHALETTTPYMFITELNLYPQPIMDGGIVTSGGQGNMSVRFDLSAYLREVKVETPAAGTAEAPK